ncbi:MAG: excinuclease ABC subunit UvrC [Clostridia bacterium]|nr:excinuclease ABC subunit UvrC [Clostridia bacterium]
MNFETASIKQKLKKLPLCPGVYLMKDKDGDIIYVGKSKLLKNRVSQYFMQSKNHSPKTLAMVSNVHDFDYMITDTEVEALVLECNLIKKYRPKYNILLKDDKQYPYIKLSMQEEFPRITMTRKVVKDGARYFGPYMSALMVKDTLETLRQIFKTRSCAKKLPQDIGKGRPCLYYHINQCSGPCCGKISKEEYREVFDQITAVLEGKSSEIMKYLTVKMYEASDALEFERAKRLRDRIESLKILSEKQKIVSTSENNRDIFGIFQDERESCVQVFYMRDGKISGTEYFVFENDATTRQELLAGFLKQYYDSSTMIPKEVLISDEIEDMDGIQAWLTQKTGHKISMVCPKRGEKAKLIQMVNHNAEESLMKLRFQRERETLKQNEILLQLRQLLHLSKPPFRIECYDISNISGTQSVGACVVYQNAKESRKDYRRFRIKTVEGSNDYESMREVIYRRIERAYKEEEAIAKGELAPEDAKFLPLPDLLLLDGGKGHVSAVKLLMETLGETVPVYGLVKDDKHRTRGITDENKEIPINVDDMLFHFLTCVQEEVHRFAISGFRKQHEENALHSELEEISGIGPEKRKILLQTFVTIERLKQADFDELRKVVGKSAAENIRLYFQERGSQNEQ